MSPDLLILDRDEILEEVDEYLLYCFYLGFQPELRVRYTSPVREPGNEDSKASWSMFYNTSKLNREFAWKDSGTGEYGDIFKLVQLMFGLKSQTAAAHKVWNDFILGNAAGAARNMTYTVKSAAPAHIKIKSKPFDGVDLQWWHDRTGADEKTLKHFNTSRLHYYWLNDEQKSPSFPGDRAYAYRIYDHYQLYFPHRDKDKKFRSDYNDNHLPGFCQLRYKTDALLITKAQKDVILCHVLGFDAVAARGENTPIPDRFMQHFRSKYRYIFTLFDNDGKHRGWSYDCPSIEIPISSGTKDPSDHCLTHGLDMTATIIDKLIKEHPSMDPTLPYIDLNTPMNRQELEEFLEKHYLNQVISIQHVGKKTRLVCGVVQRLAVEFDRSNEPICTVMINDMRYEFSVGFFIQKAQIHKYEYNGNTRTTDRPD